MREELLACFTRVLLGDALAAEFLLLQLISSVYVTFLKLVVAGAQRSHRRGSVLLQLRQEGRPAAGQVHGEPERLSGRGLVHRAPLPAPPAARAFGESRC